MIIRVTSVLAQYTGGEKKIRFEDISTLKQALDALDQKYPGIKFRFIDEQDRVRPHMNIFVNNEVAEDLDISLSEEDEVFIVQSVSGGVF